MADVFVANCVRNRPQMSRLSACSCDKAFAAMPAQTHVLATLRAAHQHPQWRAEAFFKSRDGNALGKHSPARTARQVCVLITPKQWKHGLRRRQDKSLRC